MRSLQAVTGPAASDSPQSASVAGVAAIALGACLGLAASAPAPAAEAAPAPYIEVAGSAEVKVAPDLARLDFGVTTRAESAAVAARENAARMQSVLDAVRKALGADARIGTGTYSLRSEFNAPRDGTPPRVTGYVASNIVRLETRELGRVGELVDIATGAGANQVQRIAFDLADPSAARRQALREAVLDARAEAQAIAAALDVSLGPVRSVIEQETGPIRPFTQDAVMMRAEAAPTPIEPGMISVRASVLLRIGIAN